MSPQFTPVEFDFRTKVVVVGSHPENADIDNPRGYYYGTALFYVATDAKGYRKQLHVRTFVGTYFDEKAEADAKAQCAAMNVRLTKLGKLPPGFSRWSDDRPAYGSDAYVESGQGAEDARAERLADSAESIWG